ncbi:MAG: cytochrome c oxidase subunit II [Cupriavidus sp.]|uniref:cytochrome c oxidase subunit II n=1 Tax=Cupriavidus pauculus TaxID=82633 RepID=UPI000780F3FE|nr:cytochrome c oxidase subunit II [Cupriavidus pauculus]MBU64325.1 cytochrome c oxidase subunit II [Cupriavidus sp.]
MKMWKKASAACLAGASLLVSQAASAVSDMPGGPAVRQLNLAEPVTKIAEQIHWLNWMMLIICTVIFIAVFGVMFYSIFKHRKSKGAKAASFHESITVEVIWTIVPFLIVIAMALPATKTVVAMKDTTNSDITIKATGYQWKWGYDYLKGQGEGISFVSTLTTPREQINNQQEKSNTYLMEVDNELVVPVNKKIRIVTTANDVIHAWMIPAFGVKQDAIPGFVRDTWFRAEKTGIYRGQCAELCGKEHAFMPIVVRVVSEPEYAKWVDDKKKLMAAAADDPNKTWTLDEIKVRGEKVYAANCAVCHQPTGKGGGAFPALDGSKVVNGPKAGQMHILLEGKGGMPSWKQLSDTELAAVMTYTRNSWSNKTGEVIQPADFSQARAGKFPEGGGAQAGAGDAAPKAATPPTSNDKQASLAGNRVAG